jgi:predicted PhzF superfamily epimerase YddE/YHI9
MMRNKLVSGTRFVSEQGTSMGRRSFLHVQMNAAGIDVGGHVTPLVEATMTL